MATKADLVAENKALQEKFEALEKQGLAREGELIAAATKLQSKLNDALTLGRDAHTAALAAAAAAPASAPAAPSSHSPAVAPPASSSSSAAAHRPEMRLEALAGYDGSVGTLDGWLLLFVQRCDYLKYNEEERLHSAAAHWRGPALDWWSQTPYAERPTTLDDLVVALHARFQPIDSREVLFTKLCALQQGTGPDSMNEFINKFRALIGRFVGADAMSARDKLSFFKRGLRKSTAQLLTLHDVKTLEEAERMAMRVGASGAHDLESPSSNLSNAELTAAAASAASVPSMQKQLQELRQELLAAVQDQRRGNDGRHNKGSYASASNNGAGGAYVPRPTPRIPGMTETEVKEHMEKRLCFGCSSAAHTARYCPNRAIGADGRVTWSKK